ncbi:hypothetical protein IV203_026095 [Nitzschia inconspicua]|uniref:G-protein coupled receptors family 1 profile domain-containing protein n=1 Tax=Nitzschia inconspicua TaxID=303405 RepID=A0A9K3LHZ7_9STRA|nr:hypothetical protein IV203_026095 [Nitzschia inconspicua]
MTFNSDQLGMAIFLLVAALFNFAFVITSARRTLSSKTDANGGNVISVKYNMVTYAVLAMACFDIPWVWFCMIQCWNNTFQSNSFNQNTGNDSLGCKFMGWYSSFSLVSMMGSHCLVVNYLKNFHRLDASKDCTESKSSFAGLCSLILTVACLFASLPLIQGDGYKLTPGGFCYADFTNPVQSSIILITVLVLLTVAACLWFQIKRWSQYWYFIVIFFVTWLLWVPATSYGIATGTEIPSPYMIVGAIVGHGNAIINPLLYGVQLFRILDVSGRTDGSKSVGMLDEEDPKIEIGTNNNSQFLT